MIGLGSNRLSVCRRGGMSVTQAGRGGMEWLLGGRGALGASPYSAQATIALKAQFPTQWPTIRDYGFSHPALVPFINDIVPQDARTIYSFVPTLNVARWLEFDGNSYISTDVDVEHSDFKVTTLFRAYRAQSNWDVIYGNGWGGPSRYLDAMVRSGGTIWLTTGNKEYTSGVPYSYNTDAVLEQSFTTIKLTSGSNVYEYATGSTQTPLNKSGQPFRIGYHQSFGHLIGRVSYLQYEVDGELVNWFIPATVNNVIGMIDVLSGTFYQNAGSGSFTISETPAS